MNELTQLVPGDIDFSIILSFFKPTELIFVTGVVAGPAVAMLFFNRKACKDHGWFPVYIQCFSRVALDIGLIVGIAGTAIGAVAMTIAFNANSNVEAAVSIALTTMLWGGIFVGLGYFAHNPNIPITARIPGWGGVISFVLSLFALVYMMLGTRLNLYENFMPLSDALVPYLIVLGLCFPCLRLNGKPWVVSFTDANLIATLGGLGMGIVLWFTSGGGYEEGRAAIYTCAITLMWGSIFYIIAYIASLYFGTQEQGNYQTKTWHLSEGAVFFIFLLYAPVGATEWQRESKDQAVQKANNQAQELRIEQLEAQLVELRALIKTKET